MFRSGDDCKGLIDRIVELLVYFYYSARVLHHERRAVPGGNVSGCKTLLGATARPIANQPQVANLPHVLSTT